MLAALALPLALAACAREAPSPPPRPALWRATDGDTVIWLFGTIHLLPRDERWQTGTVAQAIAESGTLITEIPATDPKVLAATFLKLARADGLPLIAERVPPGERGRLATAITAAGTSERRLDRMTTWAAAMVIGAGTARNYAGSKPAMPEAMLAEAFRSRRQEAFETVSGQLGVFATLSEPAQRRLLLEAVRDAADLGREYAVLLSAWRTGDPAAIERAFNKAFAGMPELREAFLTRRNRAWADDLVRRAERPGTLFVAVGAGHMVGNEGLPALLSRRGFRVARVQ